MSDEETRRKRAKRISRKTKKVEDISRGDKGNMEQQTDSISACSLFNILSGQQDSECGEVDSSDDS